MKKHIHFIGICGVAMCALAIAFHKKGWTVTGSDAGFFPPISTLLKNNNIAFYPGWHPEKMGAPDLVVVGNVASSQNSEWLAVQNKNIPYRSYPQIVAEHFIKENSIVCAGTYGKTTTSALLAWIFQSCGREPSYMFGGLALGDMPSAMLGNEDWSILEGDEYKSARWDNSPKFAHYSPTHLLLTSLRWDHADIYPTEESYFRVFSELVKKLPKNGLLVAGIDDANVARVVSDAPCRVIRYGLGASADYRYANIYKTAQGMRWETTHKNMTYTMSTPMLGDYQAENITGAFALSREIGLEPTEIARAVGSFQGLKRRLEKRLDRRVTIFDDIAHSPLKARAMLATLRSLYRGRIIAVFEPNTGHRRPVSIPEYENAFIDATLVIVPRLTTLKRNSADPAELLDGAQIANIISQTHANARYIDADLDVVKMLKETATDGDVIVFVGSHGFRGMIEETVKKLS